MKEMSSTLPWIRELECTVRGDYLEASASILPMEEVWTWSIMQTLDIMLWDMDLLRTSGGELY